MTELIALHTDRKVMIIVGGDPSKVSADLWRQVGADLDALDAEQAVAMTRRTSE